MSDYISREAAIAYIREQSEECQKRLKSLAGNADCGLPVGARKEES